MLVAAKVTLPFTPPVTPDVKQALAFFAALFKPGDCIHFRAVPEPKDTRTPTNHHYVLDESFPQILEQFLAYCAVESRAAFFLPGAVVSGKTGKDGVLSLPAIVVDFDKGDPAANLAAVEKEYGAATIVVASGGKTEIGPKLHAYWRLETSATGPAIKVACAIREDLAKRFGGDPSFKQEAQVIRVPGSVHLKHGPVLVRTVRLSSVGYVLGQFSRNAPVANPVSFDFNADGPDRTTDRALSEPIREGAVDDITRFEGAGVAIGHYLRNVREGRMTIDEAWEATKAWNVATLVPPWSEDRLRTDFVRLRDRELKSGGPFVPPVPGALATAAGEWFITDWPATRFSGPAPARQWLVEGLIPLATPGVFAAVGDAGKSLLSLQLALHVTADRPASGPMNFGIPKFFGCPVLGQGAAVILTAEDDAAEVHRRLNSLDPTNARGPNLIVVPMLSTGGARAILVDGRSGPEPTPFWIELRAQLLAVPNLRLVVLDPLSSFVASDINKDNVAGAALMTMLAEFAAQSGAAVMLIHHFAKAADPSSLSDARGAIRGAGALVDNGRWALALWEAEEKTATRALKLLGRKTNAAGVVYLGGLAKGNAPGAKVLRTMARNPANGLLEDITDTLESAAPRVDERDAAVYGALCQYHQTHDSKLTFKTGEKNGPLGIVKRMGLDMSGRSLSQSLERLWQQNLIAPIPGKPGVFAVVFTDK